MKVVINGTEYGLEESVNRATLGDLRVLKAKLGASAKTISATFQKFQGAKNIDLLDDDDVLRDLQAVVFLARRKAGEDVTVEEAGDVSFTDIAFASDEDDEDEESAPKA